MLPVFFFDLIRMLPLVPDRLRHSGRWRARMACQAGVFRPGGYSHPERRYRREQYWLATGNPGGLPCIDKANNKKDK